MSALWTDFLSRAVKVLPWMVSPSVCVFLAPVFGPNFAFVIALVLSTLAGMIMRSDGAIEAYQSISRELAAAREGAAA